MQTIFVLGCGAIGLAVSACLASEGKEVVAVRTSKEDVVANKIEITVDSAEATLRIPVKTVSLSKLAALDGIAVVTAKSYANQFLATSLAERKFKGPIVVLQNGLGVEDVFLEAKFAQVYRCVLYTTCQKIGENHVAFRPVASCPIGTIRGTTSDLEGIVQSLQTKRFPVHAERNIQAAIWKKAILNSVFNSICPLLDVDNGIFVRDKAIAKLAEDIITECLALAEAKGLFLAKADLIMQMMEISRKSAGQLISTLQDIKAGRKTEMEHLNLAMVRQAAYCDPEIKVTMTALLGQMVLAKSRAWAREPETRLFP
jgi:2-dehydropantoate 2-reductase